MAALCLTGSVRVKRGVNIQRILTREERRAEQRIERSYRCTKWRKRNV